MGAPCGHSDSSLCAGHPVGRQSGTIHRLHCAHCVWDLGLACCCPQALAHPQCRWLYAQLPCALRLLPLKSLAPKYAGSLLRTAAPVVAAALLWSSRTRSMDCLWPLSLPSVCKIVCAVSLCLGLFVSSVEQTARPQDTVQEQRAWRWHMV